MDFSLPHSTQLHKSIPKTSFYRRGKLSTQVKDEFVQLVDKITWIHNLSEKTLAIPKTDIVEEIQIFHIDLKQHIIPVKVLQTIDRSIPYPILFQLDYQGLTCTAIFSKITQHNQLYTTEWGSKEMLKFNGHTLQVIFENLVKQHLPERPVQNENLDQIIQSDLSRRKLQREITSLKSKIRKASQFKEQVELNMKLRELEETREKIS